MGKISTSQVYYEIQEKIGEGLTSEVYRAFRSDPNGWTRQEVALKIIKSRKNIQILKREFEKLLKIRSKYCVQVIAWESLPQGQALVLEFLNGLTLEKIERRGGLTKDLTYEVLTQSLLGLKALHRQGIVHGDLNLKNIIVTGSGVIKLIDFGFFQAGQQSLVTPRWASPQVLRGLAPKPEDDFYSLSQLESFLISSDSDRPSHSEKGFKSDHQKKHSKSSFSHYGQSRASRRRSLSKVVRSLMSFNVQETRIINHQKKTFVKPGKKRGFLGFIRFFVFRYPGGKNRENQRSLSERIGDFKVHPVFISRYGKKFFLYMILVFSSLFFIFVPLETDRSKGFGSLKVTGHRWIRFSINGLPPRYTPVEPLNLRSGTYKLIWNTSEQPVVEEEIEILPEKTFHFQPEKREE